MASAIFVGLGNAADIKRFIAKNHVPLGSEKALWKYIVEFFVDETFNSITIFAA